jgi:hypothetical protein
MRIKLTRKWRRWPRGQQLTGGAAREALAEGAGREMTAAAPEGPLAEEE